MPSPQACQRNAWVGWGNGILGSCPIPQHPKLPLQRLLLCNLLRQLLLRCLGLLSPLLPLGCLGLQPCQRRLQPRHGLPIQPLHLLRGQPCLRCGNLLLQQLQHLGIACLQPLLVALQRCQLRLPAADLT